MHYVLLAIKYDLILCWLFGSYWLFNASFGARGSKPSRKHFHWTISCLVSFAWPLFFLCLLLTCGQRRPWSLLEAINDFFERAFGTYEEAAT